MRAGITDLRQLAEYIWRVGVTTVLSLERVHLKGLLASRDGQTLATSTRPRKLAAVRSFRFLADTGYQTGDPAADVVPLAGVEPAPVPDTARLRAPAASCPARSQGCRAQLSRFFTP